MKVVILAGGHGTRIADLTNLIPKPMVPIGGIPILVHIMKIYSSFGHKEFCILLGHKGSIIKAYFLSEKFPECEINLIETGEDTMTGGRLLKAKEIIDKDTFFLTYGDGLGNIDINALLKFHRKKNKIMTVTTVRPPARFGELELDNDLVTSFDEKPQMQKGWINGGFFVVDPTFIDYIKDETILISIDTFDENIVCYTEIFKNFSSDENIKKDQFKNFFYNDIKRNDLACIIYTSGTTGNPKGVMLSHGGILSNCEGAREILDILVKNEKPVFLTWLPLSHSYEHTVQFIQISLGAKVFYAESLEKLLNNMVVAQPTIMTAVPRFYQNLYSKISFNFSKQKGFKKNLIENI